MKSELAIQGMTSNNCARHVREALQEAPGVERAIVSLGENRATVVWKPDANTSLAPLFAALHEAGYEGAPIAEAKRPSLWSPLQGWRR